MTEDMTTITDPFDRKHYHHWIEDRVRFSDLDPLGHVNNNAISQYFENARALFYMRLTPLWPRGDKLFVLARVEVNYRHELHMPAHLKIGTGVRKIGTTSLTLTNVLYSDRVGIAYGQSVSVLIDKKKRRPVPIDDELRSLIQDILDTPNDE
ncbi:MAG: acyl-CoA thioesterase [Alphaproteobacteria bacterium]|nr:acyl-CoA thioesterase [Alphaproteobacteria bacterium]MBV8548112.1 acyl-CoA thioesterase [Alphaproteobacteria bacterium]